MIKRRLFQILPLLFFMAIAIQLSTAAKCYGGAFAYVPNYDNDNVSIIKVLDNSITGDITVGGNPFGVTVGGEYIYVTNASDGTVSAISLTYNSVIEIIDAGISPGGVAASSDGSYIYVANYSERTLSIIDISTRNRMTLDIGQWPVGVAMSPNQDYIYVTNSGDDSLSIISADSHELFVTLRDDYYLNHISSDDDVAFNMPWAVAVSPDGYYIYVVNNNKGEQGTVSIISASTIYSLGESFSWDDYDAAADEGPYSLYAPVTVGNDPRCVVVTPAKDYLYVTNYADDTVSVISLSDYSVDTVSVGDGPYGISVTPSGAFVYVVNQLSGTISVIDTDDNTVIATVDIGNSPIGFGNFIGGKPPRTPSSLVAVRVDTNVIKITWNDNSDDEIGFKLMRKKYIGGTFSQIATLDANITEYTDSSLDNDANYYYMVCSYNHAGDSEYSNINYATTGSDDTGCFIATAAYDSSIELFCGITWLFIFFGPISAMMLMVSFVSLMIFSIDFIKRCLARE